MKIKYSPCKWNNNARSNFKDSVQPETQIKYINENTLMIDNELYEFDELSIEYPNIHELTDGYILEAHRNNENELYLTVRRFYLESCIWDTGDYQILQNEEIREYLEENSIEPEIIEETLEIQN